jgi:[ribosomal protein S18]-alanine N-acetyltransferase
VSRCRLRPTASADLPALVALERAAFSDPWTAAMLREALAEPSTLSLVAEDDAGTFLGAVLARHAAGEGEILSIAVDPARRGAGHGRTLLDGALAALAAAGAGTVWLEVRRSNEAAQRLYAAAGFVAVGVRRGYYRDPTEDAVVLRRDLAPALS